MYNPRLFLSRVSFFSKPGLLPWDTARPPDLLQSFLGTAHKGCFTSVIAKKHPIGQKYQKKQRHCRPQMTPGRRGWLML
ncbi:rCG38040 [Rattus norvegicus]|uniref:RCG38040 n=1 Tax=Rattus norvegicus TaxID=10116 RepID=A6IVE7_RAT|nr:rCG38040 [Rattus norvegicus]